MAEIWRSDVSPGPARDPVTCTLIRLAPNSARHVLFLQVSYTILPYPFYQRNVSFNFTQAVQLLGRPDSTIRDCCKTHKIALKRITAPDILQRLMAIGDVKQSARSTTLIPLAGVRRICGHMLPLESLLASELKTLSLTSKGPPPTHIGLGMPPLPLMMGSVPLITPPPWVVAMTAMSNLASTSAMPPAPDEQRTAPGVMLQQLVCFILASMSMLN
jgi:hypothetical protein